MGRIPTRVDVLGTGTGDKSFKGLKFTANAAGSTVKLEKKGSPNDVSLAVSYDEGETWTSYTIGDELIIQDEGGTLCFRAADGVTNAKFAKDQYSNYHQFVFTGSVNASGNIMSLISKNMPSNFTSSNTYAFCNLFEGTSGHSQLADISELRLPAMTLASYCYTRMFYNCTAITAAPALPATALATSCYQYMFYGCTSLMAAPVLPAETLAQYCYQYMFSGCKALTKAPELPAMTLVQSCYSYMFQGCTALATAPKLPATTLAMYCYQYMFAGTSLTTAPELPVTAPAQYCYQYMFQSCSSLSFAKVSFTQWSNSTSYWMSSVTTSGVLVCPAQLGTNSTITRGASYCPTNWNVFNYDGFQIYAVTAGSTVSMSKTGNPPSVSLEYSVDNGATWAAFDDAGGTTVTLANAGDSVCIRAGAGGNSAFASSLDDYHSFAFTGSVGVFGNIMQLLSQDETFDSADTALSDFTFANLFYNQTALTNASALQLPATTLAASCYRQMFYGCTALTKAPALPATSLADYCYYYMFYGCSALTKAPSLPATSLAQYCYYGMFHSCAALTAVPSILPATTLAKYCCWNMFNNCTSLKTAPALPAETLADGCYGYMFSRCSALTAAPELPATTLDVSCYTSMFYGCKSISAIPDLPAKTLLNGCYENMFYNCTSITITPEVLPATTLGEKCCQYMFYGCTSLTRPIELPATTLAVSCYNNMFCNCSSLTAAPELPATTLADYCYYYMFYGCKSIVAVPTVLPAMELSEYCYSRMFYGCSQLKTAPVLPAKTLVKCCYDSMFRDCTTLVAISASFTDWKTSLSSTRTWTYNITSFGEFTCPSELGDSSTIQRGGDYCPVNWNVSRLPYYGFRVKAKTAGSTVSMSKTGNPPSVSLEYSVDNGVTWTAFDDAGGTTITIQNAGDEVCFRAGADGNSAFASGLDDYHSFVFTGNVEVRGNIMSLLLRDQTADFSNIASTYALAYLFNGQTALTDASNLELPAKTLIDGCYSGMFKNCTSITAAPKLPATMLADGCYQYMFQDCQALATAPTLPAKQLANRCYSNMFQGCLSLVDAPELPATTLAQYCYSGMFKNCRSMTTAPELPAVFLTAGCYAGMFQNCETLAAITVYFKDWNAERQSTSDWLDNVATLGTLTCPDALGDSSTILRGPSYCPVNWNIKQHSSQFWGFYVKALEANATVRVRRSSTSIKTANLYYSTDNGVTWNYTYNNSSSSVTVTMANAGDTVCFRSSDGGNNEFSNSSDYYFFAFTGNVAVGGNVMSLLQQNWRNSLATINCKYMFYNLFKNCTTLVDASELKLPAMRLAPYCYYYMFTGCSSLIKAPKLPATALAAYCYYYMFYNCTSLAEAPDLPATTLIDCCYSYMFCGCASLVKAPRLPSTHLASSCYSNMFQGCRSLQAAPELPATTLATDCYSQMFYGCSSLTAAPELPATILAGSCYWGMFRDCWSLESPPAVLPTKTLNSSCCKEMFYGCSSLTAAPELPAEKLQSNCCYGMFQNCKAITDAPALPAPTLSSSCYNYMFNGCSKLSSADVSFTAWGSNTSYWMQSVRTYGVFTCPSALGTQDTITRGYSNCPTYWTVQAPPYKGFKVKAKEAGVRVGIYRSMGTGCPEISLEYSIDNGAAWAEFSVGTSIQLADAGDEIYIRAPSGVTNAQFGSNNAYNHFSFTGSVDVAGNIMSLISQDMPSNFTPSYAFYGLFKDATTLIDASKLELPAMQLTTFCYGQMFYGCSSLTAAPELPAAKLAANCYIQMFQNCEALQTAPQLPATTLAARCYSSMFYGCSSLTTPPELPATTLAIMCYTYMFYNCTSLAIAPELPAMTLTLNCYYCMFYGCTSLSEAPKLPAITLASSCYSNMFYGCSSLIVAPELPATELATNCYNEMFDNCSSLNYVKASFTDWNTAAGSTTNWLSGVAPAGTLVCPTALGTASTIERGPSYCPTGWNVEELQYWGFKIRALQANSTVFISKTGSPAAISLEYSTDGGGTWTTFTPNTTTVSLANIGDEVCFRAGADGNSAFASGLDDYHSFAFAGNVEVRGDIMSLLSKNQTNDFPDTAVRYIFARLFRDQTALANAAELELPSTAVSRYCYSGMFSGCSSLTTPPAILPAASLADFCYSGMFQGCSSLSAAPQLPATTLAAYCYYNMFSGCSALPKAPALPAITPAGYCYANMFSGCSSLTAMPVLPAKTLAVHCYDGMFSGCASATDIPKLLALNLVDGCYRGMFKNCSSITDVPRLPATSLVADCYTEMFSGCSSLSSVSVSFTSWNDGSTTNWLSDVASSGVFTCMTSLGTSSTIQRGDSYCPVNWNVEELLYWGFKVKALQANSTVKMTKKGSPTAPKLRYSKDNGNTWTTFTAGSTTVTLTNVGDEVCFSAGDGINKAFYFGSSSYYAFAFTGGVSIAGNIMSLLCNTETTEFADVSTYSVFSRLFYQASCLIDAAYLELPASVLPNYCYNYMFSSCSALTAAPELPATTLANSCYDSMFFGCSLLQAAPELPATTLANTCYYQMFRNCQSLTTVPELPATTLADGCYAYMFNQCGSLSTAPELPATTLASGCYNSMFNSCSSLMAPPELPATTLASNCYMYMFAGCSSLTATPELPATATLINCYDHMFASCSSLISASDLPAVTVKDAAYASMFFKCTSLTKAPVIHATAIGNMSLNQMFAGCTRLSSVEVSLTSWGANSSGTSYWLSAVAAAGTFTCPTALGTQSNIKRGIGYCPSNWTVINK